VSLFQHFGGELAALGGAFLWAVAALVYGRVGRVVPPLEMNLLKGVLALGMMAITLLLRGETPASLTGIDPAAVGFLLLSGAVGIGLGDTAYFESLKAFGPRRALLLGTLAPPAAAIMALLLLDERLSPGAWAGILVTALGVTWVITERAPDETGRGAQVLRGTAFGLLAALTQASGAVLSRAGFVRADLSSLWAAFLRLAAGVILLAAWILVARQGIGRWLRQPEARSLWGRLLLAVFWGTYLAIWLQQVAFKLTQAGIAQTLLATSPLFVLPFAAWGGERISYRAAAGAALALVGVALLFGLR
jgi:drug/metabolite transporter (DMT)-like permease